MNVNTSSSALFGSLSSKTPTLGLAIGSIILLLSYFFLASNKSKSTKTKEFAGTKTLYQHYKFIRELGDRRDPYEEFIQNSPEAPIIKVEAVVRQIYGVYEKDAVRELFMNSHLFVRPNRPQELLEGVLDYALFVLPTNGPHWKRHRKLIQPGFGPIHLQNVGRYSVQSVQELFDVWDNMPKEDGNGEKFTVNIKVVFESLALDILGQVAFGQLLGMVKRLAHDPNPHWPALEVLVGGTLLKRALTPKFMWNYRGIGNESPVIMKAKNEMDDFMRKLAEERRADIAKAKLETSEVGKFEKEKDVLHRLLMSSGEDGLSDKEIFGELLGFFLAGHETTSNTLSFAILELCKSPAVQESLYESIKDVDFISDPMAALSTCPTLLESVLKETQRLHSIVPRIPRTNTEECTLQGYTFPKDSIFHVYVKGLHLNAAYHPDPYKFDVRRFEEGRIMPGTFLPFGDGIHNCIGQKMAMIESKLILALLVQRYKFELVPGQTLRQYYSVTKSLKDGLNLTMTKR